MTFDLNETEIKNFEEIKSAIMMLFDGDIGQFQFIFHESNGIGRVIEVYSERLDMRWDITDYRW